MDFVVHESQELVVCQLSGSFSFCDYDAFGRIIHHIDTCSAETFTLDLSAVSFMDSSAIWMVLVAKHAAFRRLLHFSVLGAAPDVDQILAEETSAPVWDRRRERRLILMHGEPNPSPDLLQYARSLGIATIPDPSSAHSHMTWGQGADADHMIQSLAVPECGFIELVDGQIHTVSKRLLDAVRSGGCALSVSTKTASRVELAQMFGLAVRQRFPAIQGEIELCLAEAISNGVLHGNLGIPSDLRSCSSDFRLFQKTMDDRLAQADYANKRLEVMLVPLGGDFISLCVSDSGAGYNFVEQLGKPLVPGAKHGRGIGLIRSIARAVWAENEGRSIVMVFSC